MINIYKLHTLWTMRGFSKLNFSPLSFFIFYLKSLILRFGWILKLWYQSFHLLLKIKNYAFNFSYINIILLLILICTLFNYISNSFAQNIAYIHTPYTFSSILNIHILATNLLVIRNWRFRVWRMYVTILSISLVRIFVLYIFLWAWILSFNQLF
jgi:hypothetical protein